MIIQRKKLLIAAAISSALVAAPSFATHVWGNASGTYHWDAQSLPVQISVIDSVATSWQTEMETSIDKWNISTVLNLAVNSVDDGSSARTNCAIANGELRVCNAAYGTSVGWLGLASLNIDANNHILYGVAKLNDSFTMDQDQKNSVMCQEIGHLFGLGHTSTDGSSQNTCMDYSSNSADGVWPNAHDYTLLEEIYGHIGGVTPPPTGSGELTNGTPETNVSGATNSEVAYYIDVPAGATDLSININGGSGDADLYVKFGSAPTTTSSDCRPYLGGNSETCDFAAPNEGRYYVMIRGYQAYSGVTLTASFTDGGGGTTPPDCTAGNGVLCNGVTESGLSAARRQTVNYYLDVPAGASNLAFNISGGTGDADLYVRYASAPTTSSWDCRPYKNGNTENCNFAAPSTGRYYVMVRAYQAFSGVSLTATYDGGTASAQSVQSEHGVRIEVHGRSEIWLKHHDNGSKTLTHIYLAGEENEVNEEENDD